VCLYVYEPEVIDAPDFDPSHLVFINQSLASLDRALRNMGAHLTLRTGRMPDVLDELHQQVVVAGLWSHEETGNAITYARDRRVAAWADRNNVVWKEYPTNGVVRRLDGRDGWARLWAARMNAPIAPAPGSINPAAGLAAGKIRSPQSFGLEKSVRREVQIGGVEVATGTLESFLSHRGVNYRADMSSPATAWSSCSRLSSYLTWGNLSVRQVYKRTRERRAELDSRQNSGAAVDRLWRGSLSAFEQRLRWRCHFIQKLEDEPDIEFHNMNRAYDGLREDEFDASRFTAWCDGCTGYPMVDACMRALHESGWINFRMRAMLMSFASYHLWLHWRPTALHLARLFLDYEPGIHYSQTQMQSGVTGINAIRIYSPIKQVIDQDPDGEFVRRYCPELSRVPAEYVAAPHTMPLSVQNRIGCIIGKHYPVPIVEHAVAYRQARARVYAIKASAAARQAASEVYQKHGSRRRPARRARVRT
jgi:deoxyribodipyrimidine photo-lyase